LYGLRNMDEGACQDHPRYFDGCADINAKLNFTMPVLFRFFRKSRYRLNVIGMVVLVGVYLGGDLVNFEF